MKHNPINFVARYAFKLVDVDFSCSLQFQSNVQLAITHELLGDKEGQKRKK